jgi:hypothetical protein
MAFIADDARLHVQACVARLDPALAEAALVDEIGEFDALRFRVQQEQRMARLHALACALADAAAGQHSITFTASPPRAVSLYLVFMSAPVSRMVLITWSSDT